MCSDGGRVKQHIVGTVLILLVIHRGEHIQTQLLYGSLLQRARAEISQKERGFRKQNSPYKPNLAPYVFLSAVEECCTVIALGEHR